MNIVRTTAPLSATDARDLTDRIKGAAESLWSLLLEAHERQAWKALGYGRWEDYIRTEFGMSRSRSYQLLDQGRAIAAICEAAGVQDPGQIDLNSEQARDIKPHLPEVAETVRHKVEAGTPPEEAVKESVAEKREEIRTERKQDAPSPKVEDPAPKPPSAPTKRLDMHRLQKFIDAALAASTDSDAQIDAIATNEIMLRGLAKARDLADRIIRRHSAGRSHASA